MLTVEALLSYRFAVPRTIFFTLRLAEPRGTVRLAFGAAFLRAVRFALLRSSLLSDFVFAMSFQSEEFEPEPITALERLRTSEVLRAMGQEQTTAR